MKYNSTGKRYSLVICSTIHVRVWGSGPRESGLLAAGSGVLASAEYVARWVVATSVAGRVPRGVGARSSDGQVVLVTWKGWNAGKRALGAHVRS